MVLFSSVPQVPKLSNTTYFFQNIWNKRRTSLRMQNVLRQYVCPKYSHPEGVFNIKMEVEKLVVLSF